MRWTTNLLATSLATALGHSPSDTCTNTTPLTNQVYKTYYPIRISKGLVCSNESTTGPSFSSDSCPLHSWAYVSYGTRFNVTFTADGQRDALIDLLGRVPWDPIVRARNNISGIVTNETFYVPKGWSGYVRFEEEYACGTSFVKGCKGNLADFEKSYIEACYPTYNTGSGTIPMFYSEKSLVRVDAETARGMTDHPYGTNETASLLGLLGAEQEIMGIAAEL